MLSPFSDPNKAHDRYENKLNMTHHNNNPSGNPKSTANCGNDTVTKPLSIDPIPVTSVVERIIISVPLFDVTGSVLVAVLSRLLSNV